MLKDCIEIFARELEKTEEQFGNREKFILDSYIPADGDYIVVQKDGTLKSRSFKLDKKTRTLNGMISGSQLDDDIKFYDYHSRLVSMDKPQDPKKVIHSNSYLSFWVKQDSLDNGKLDMQAIDRYYDVLKNPRAKYKNVQDAKMYDYIAEKVGDVNKEKLEYSRNWIKQNIFKLKDMGIELTGKNYLKIFFEDDKELYVREEQRYLMTKIYNKNDYFTKSLFSKVTLTPSKLHLRMVHYYLEVQTMSKTILIIEDEKRLADALGQIMQEARYQADIVYDGRDGLAYASSGDYDVIVLDVMLPGMDGFEVVHHLRESKISTPVIMLTALDDVKNKITGLDSGADDYMTKPFVPEELLARIRALSRRQGEVILEELTFDDLTLNLSSNDLSCKNKSIHLGYKEFEILKILMSNPKILISKETLIVKVWGAESAAESNNVEAYISFLRKKFHYLDSKVTIGTVRKVGYRLESEETS